MKAKTYITLFILTCSIAMAHAYGTLGHYIIGEIAQQSIAPATQERLKPLLNNATLPMVSNWADWQKSNPDYANRSNWHYLNLDSGLTRQQFQQVAYRTDAGQNLYQVDRLIKVLQQNPNDTVALLYLIHLVEDLHNPMHYGRSSDRGGNDVPVQWFGRTVNLHALWDDMLLETRKMSYTEYANHLLTQSEYQPIPFQPDMLADWAWENYCNTGIIYDTRELTAKPYQYIYQFAPMWESALTNGGYRLAMILDAIYNK